MKRKSPNQLTKKQLESLSKFSKLLNREIPLKISKAKNPKREANRILLKWSQEYGNLKSKKEQKLAEFK